MYHVAPMLLLLFIVVISCILAEHPQMKSSRARFKKLVQLGKASDVCVCLCVLMNCRSYMATQCTPCVIDIVLVYCLCVSVHACLFVTSNFAVDLIFIHKYTGLLPCETAAKHSLWLVLHEQVADMPTH